MATYIGTNESLPQIVITPNKGFSQARDGAGKTPAATPSGSAHDTAQARPSPGQVRNKSAFEGKEAAAASDAGLWGDDGFTFGDFIDIINPLQHIPIVSTIYRAVTGDQISAGARMVGGGLLGGAVGFAVSALSSAVEGGTGKDIGGHMLAMVSGGGEAAEDALSAAAKDSKAAQLAKASGATLLTATEPVSRMEAEEALELAAATAPPPPAPVTPQQASVQAIALARESSKDRAVYALGGLETATQRYQQVQSMNRMQGTVLGLGVKG